MTLLLAVTAGLSGCYKPGFIKRDETDAVAATPKASPPPVIDPTSPLTPRELLAARLINARGADANSPAMTVGKLIEFADRYLACDCAEKRFVRSWERIDGGYQLNTNSEIVRPMRFICAEAAPSMQCFLTEIDRGKSVQPLDQRFMPGSDFIQFIYEHGLNCQRTEPCPESTAGATAVPSETPQ